MTGNQRKGSQPGSSDLAWPDHAFLAQKCRLPAKASWGASDGRGWAPLSRPPLPPPAQAMSGRQRIRPEGSVSQGGRVDAAPIPPHPSLDSAKGSPELIWTPWPDPHPLLLLQGPESKSSFRCTRPSFPLSWAPQTPLPLRVRAEGGCVPDGPTQGGGARWVPWPAAQEAWACN